MRSQLTVRLPPDLSRLLSSAARRSQRKPSEIVRLALRKYLDPAPDRPGWAYDRVADLIGSINSGPSDLAERHSEYVLESLKRGR
jgi:hypothetical protein